MNAPLNHRRGFHLLDIASLVVGYSLASLLVRAFWPSGETPSFVALSVLGLAFLWLGLAMSGPIVLLGHRRAETAAAEENDLPPPRSWAELAWLIVGFYWTGLTVLVVPARAHNSRVLDSAFLGLFPVLAALGLRWFRPRARETARTSADWTHHAAVILLVTWPFAWVALILLGKSLP